MKRLKRVEIATKGFTLIELLIVVAIIGILAAIAIPNFLQAQTRAKVSRVMADMRTVAHGLETYAVDNTAYVQDDDVTQRVDGGTAAGYYGLARLTTPVEYLRKVPVDPFSVFGGLTNEWGTGLIGNDSTYLYDSPREDYGFGWSATESFQRGYTFVLSSYGPARTQLPPGSNIGLWLTQVLAAWKLPLVYDPTNGTVSFGVIGYTNKGFYDGSSWPDLN
jgi:type II secretion system protein G